MYYVHQPKFLLLVPQVPFEPLDLQHSFLIMQTNITARISWQHPTSDVPIIGYRIIWGQATEADEMGHTHIEPETSLTKVISKVRKTYHVGLYCSIATPSLSCGYLTKHVCTL